MQRILILNGHPDPQPNRFCAALCDAYAEGALAAGHEVRRLEAGAMDFPLVRGSARFEGAPPPPDIVKAQNSISWAAHLVIIHPLWLGSPPALLKAFFEQVFRYGFAISRPGDGPMRGLLTGRSARIVATMGMPAPVYRWVFGGAGVRAEELGVLGQSGIGPVRHSFVGDVEGDPHGRQKALEAMRTLGQRAR